MLLTVNSYRERVYLDRFDDDFYTRTTLYVFLIFDKDRCEHWIERVLGNFLVYFIKIEKSTIIYPPTTLSEIQSAFKPSVKRKHQKKKNAKIVQDRFKIRIEKIHRRKNRLNWPVRIAPTITRLTGSTLAVVNSSISLNFFPKTILCDFHVTIENT